MPGWVPRNQSLKARIVRSGVVNLNAGSGTRQPAPYVASSSFSGRAGTGIGRPSSVGLAQRRDPLPLERDADLAHQVEPAVVEEPAEHVEARG